MALNPQQVKNIKANPESKFTRFHDGEGLFLFVNPKNQKWWRFKYRFAGKHKMLSLGTYPKVSLADARAETQKMKKLLSEGFDPGAKRKEAKEAEKGNSSNTFKAVALEWWERMKATKAEKHRARILRSLEIDAFPEIGSKLVSEITAADLDKVAKRIEARKKYETAHRVIGRCGEVILYAIRTDRAHTDPTPAVKKALKPAEKKHMAAVTKPKEVGAILRAVDGYNGSVIVCSALKLAPLFFVRPGELRHAEWKDFDFKKAEWSYTASKTKHPHIVPLSTQALDILKGLQKVSGDGRYVFPAPTSKDRPMSNNAILAAFRRMGIPKEEHCGHGWRATARTMLDEQLKYPVPTIEMQLAHLVRDSTGRAYNRTEYIKERHEMMQTWADYLDTLREKTGD